MDNNLCLRRVMVPFNFWEMDTDLIGTATLRGELQQTVNGWLQSYQDPQECRTLHVAWSPVSEKIWVVSSYNDKNICLIDTDSQTVTSTILLEFQPLYVAWNPTGTQVATTGAGVIIK